MSILGQLLSDMPRQWKLQRTFNFDFLLPDISGIAGHEISKYCQDCKIGDYDIAALSTIKAGAFEQKFSGDLKIKEVVATFLKPVNDIVSDYFYAWRTLIVDKQGFHNVKSIYAKTAYLKLYDRDGSETDTYKMIGIFPTTLPSIDVSYTNEDIVKFPITFSVDWIERN